MHIVELESLDERAVDQRRMGRRKPLRRAPHAACRCRIHLRQGAHEDPAPFQVGAVQRAPERVQYQQAYALDHSDGICSSARVETKAATSRVYRLSRAAAPADPMLAISLCVHIKPENLKSEV
jgi:hypothetical protein